MNDRRLGSRSAEHGLRTSEISRCVQPYKLYGGPDDPLKECSFGALRKKEKDITLEKDFNFIKLVNFHPFRAMKKEFHRILSIKKNTKYLDGITL